MPVQSIECQLTQAQMKRYLAGADFPESIVAALERHLKVCPDCMAEANRQREALGGAPVDIAQAVVAAQPALSLAQKVGAIVSKRTKPGPALTESLLSAPGHDAGKPSSIDLLKTPKNLVLSGSLAIVLVLMSTVLRNPTTMFGPRASTKLSTPPATQVEEPKAATTNDEKSEPDQAPSVGHEETVARQTEPALTQPDSTPSGRAEPPKDLEKTAEKPEPVKGANKVLPHVGGTVVVAESGRPAAVRKSPSSATRPKTKKRPVPRLKKTRSKPPVNQIRVYKP